jgi:hypothetical protein
MRPADAGNDNVASHKPQVAKNSQTGKPQSSKAPLGTLELFLFSHWRFFVVCDGVIREFDARSTSGHSFTVTVLFPSIISSNTFSTSSFRNRMQPIEAILPMLSGSMVPWMP